MVWRSLAIDWQIVFFRQKGWAWLNLHFWITMVKFYSRIGLTMAHFDQFLYFSSYLLGQCVSFDCRINYPDWKRWSRNSAICRWSMLSCFDSCMYLVRQLWCWLSQDSYRSHAWRFRTCTFWRKISLAGYLLIDFKTRNLKRTPWLTARVYFKPWWSLPPWCY